MAVPGSGSTTQVRIQSAVLISVCLHELQVHVGGISSPIKSKHSPAWVIISSHGDFSLERSFYNWFFISSHFSKKFFEYKNICFQNNFFVSKTPFLTSHKLIFSFLFHFNSFRCFLVKHNKFW